MKVSVSEAANLMSVNRESVYAAIKRGRLKHLYDEKGNIVIDFEDLDAYTSSLYKRSETSTYNGCQLFDKTLGYYNITECCNILQLKRQKVYFHIREGKLKATKKGGQLVVSLKDIMEYKNTYMKSEEIQNVG